MSMTGMTASGGWCAPSDQVYNFLLGSDDPPPPSYCPDWNGPTQEECHMHSLGGDVPYWRSWHECKDEHIGPHDVCVCEDCGAQRIVMKEQA